MEKKSSYRFRERAASSAGKEGQAAAEGTPIFNNAAHGEPLKTAGNYEGAERKGGETTRPYEGGKEPPPHENALVVAFENSVVLVRHFFSDTGNVEEIFNEYINEKVSKNT